MFSCVQKLKPRSDQEENELVIFHLRQLCDNKQTSHVHIGEVCQIHAHPNYGVKISPLQK